MPATTRSQTGNSKPFSRGPVQPLTGPSTPRRRAGPSSNHTTPTKPRVPTANSGTPTSSRRVASTPNKPPTVLKQGPPRHRSMAPSPSPSIINIAQRMKEELDELPQRLPSPMPSDLASDEEHYYYNHWQHKTFTPEQQIARERRLHPELYKDYDKYEAYLNQSKPLPPMRSPHPQWRAVDPITYTGPDTFEKYGINVDPFVPRQEPLGRKESYSTLMNEVFDFGAASSSPVQKHCSVSTSRQPSVASPRMGQQNHNKYGHH